MLQQIEHASPGRFEFHVLVDASHLGVRKLASAFESGGKPPHSKTWNPDASLHFWVPPDAGSPTSAISFSNIRRLTEISSTLVRDLQADLLYLPFGVTPHVCPDIPIVSAIDAIRDGDATSLESVDRLARVSCAIECGLVEIAHRLQREFLRSPESVFVPTSEADLAVQWGDVFLKATQAFAAGGIGWSWSPSVDAVTNLPPAPDAGEGDILLQIDEPTRWDNPVPLLQIRGWCLSNTASPVATLFVRSVDGTWEGVYGLARPDVAAVFPGRDGATASGFILRLPRPAQIPSPISIEVRFADGRHVAVLRPVVE